MSALKNLSGQKFGKLIILERSASNNQYWDCRCECGTRVSVREDHLIRKETTSCRKCGSGWHRKNIINQRFGRYTVISFAGLGNSGCYLWKVRCDCGTIKIVRGSFLRNGVILSCGCLHREKLIERLTTHGLSKTKEYRAWLQRNRLEKDSKWTWVMEAALQTMFPVCVNCGNKKNLATDHVKPISKGFGLIPGNATRLCKICNSRKNAKMPDQLPPEFQDKVLKAAEQFRLAWSGGF